MADLIVALFLVFFLLRWALETALAVLNLSHTLATPPGVPQPLVGRVDAETAARSRGYAVARLRFGLVRGVAGSAAVLAVLFSGALPWLEQQLTLWRLRVGPRVWEGLAWGPLSLDRLELQAVVVGPLEGPHLFVGFLAALVAASALAGLPFAVYSTFWIEARFGFNRATPGAWLRDRCKGGLLTGLLGVPFLYGVYFFMAWSGPWWWVWLFGFVAVGQMVLVWLFPALIAPLFNNFTPLPAGVLRMRLESLAHRAGFRPGGIFVMDASRRSGHSNAYFTGLFRPRIVLFDTLLKEMSVDEALAVLAHEIGHFRLRHVRNGLLLGLAWLLGMLYVLSLVADWEPLFTAFKFPAPSHHAVLALAVLGGGAFTFFLAPLTAWFSRRREYAADAFSVRLLNFPDPLKSALVRLNGQNLANLNPHPWYSSYHYSHPTLLERLAAIDRLPVPGLAGPPPPG